MLNFVLSHLLAAGLSFSFIFQSQVEMNWNIANFLPKAASCQEFFKVFSSVHNHFYSEDIFMQFDHALTTSGL